MDLKTRWRHAASTIAALAALALAGGGATATTAGADAFGQIGSGFGGTQAVGGPDSAATFAQPLFFGADPSDGSVYVVDRASSSLYRLRKFTAAGVEQAVATFPSSDSNGDILLQGVVVDPARHRVELLQYQATADTVNGVAAAQKILVYSTTPSGSQLVAPGDVPSGQFALPSPTGSTPIDLPDGFALDPQSGNVLISGYDINVSHAIVLAIRPDGTPGTRFVDTTDRIIFGDQLLQGLAVGPDGAVYVGSVAGGSAGLSVLRLPPTLDSIAALPRASNATPDTRGLGNPAGTGDNPTSWPGSQGFNSYGAQLAVSPDGGTLYFEGAIATASSATAGNYIVTSYSLTDHRLGLIYGGNGASLTSCRITQGQFSIAALADGTLDVFDPLPAGYTAPGGNRVMPFGSGGSGCPAPTASFTVAGSGATASTAQKGAAITLDASGSDLHGASPTELDWTVTGPGGFTETVTGTPAALTLQHTFVKAGVYTIDLAMRVSGSALGDPPPAAEKTLTVTAGTPTGAFSPSTRTPAAGGSVTFDASGSIDPTGSDAGGPTHTLKRYAWDFGDGATQTTTTPTVTHAFANGAAAPVARAVRLTVTSVDDVTSAAVAQTITVGGAPSAGPGPGTGTPPGGGTPIVNPPLRPAPPAAGAFTVGAAKATKTGGLALAVTLPGAGRVALKATTTVATKVKGRTKRRTLTVASVSRTLGSGAGTLTVTPSAAAKALLKKHALTVRITVTFTPAGGGRPVVKTLTATLKKTAAVKKKKR